MRKRECRVRLFAAKIVVLDPTSVLGSRHLLPFPCDYLAQGETSLRENRYFLDNRRFFCIIAVYFSIFPDFSRQGQSLTFQELILTLQAFWASKGCVIHQPYDTEVGAGTFHPATFLRVLGPEPWKAAYVQPSRRPTDGRYGENPNRLQHYYQFQVILKPHPENVQELYLESLVQLGINPLKHDIRFVEDDWESPTLGAWGLGWEVWLNGMEVTQFTYFQQVGRHRSQTHFRRAHLRRRTACHVSPGREQRL